MRLCLAATVAALVVVVLAGCEQPPIDGFPQRQAMNAWAMDYYTTQMIDNAIVAQHALFPYHFVANSARLNELGERDLSVLAAHYIANAGQLTVRRGEADETLYNARLAAVRETLVGAGVAESRVKMDDGLPGGPGLVGDRCLVIMGGKTATPAYPESEKPIHSSTSGSSGGVLR